jgi:spore germination cell wall hydrolase CwlJ-like protein
MTIDRRSPPSATLQAIVAAIALLAIFAPVLLIRFAPPLVRHHVARSAPPRVVPAAEVPAVEPVAFQDLDPSDARSFNASVPFVDGPNPAARPFKLDGDELQRRRAIDCMAAAVLYEAGDDPTGQRAVAQVVINRVRHPAFPKTICGVVFQGSERATGCQFTFTCDGALMRNHWRDVQWTRARETATAALTGAVFKPVGYATHYHTDWVVPYWQSSLDKIAAVGTHLFFRWTGWWGTPPAFNRHVSSDEPAIAQLAAYSDAHRGGVEMAGGQVEGALFDAAAAKAALPPPVAGDGNSFLITLDDDALSPDGFAVLAQRTCGDRAYCKVMGWTDAAKTATKLPLKPVQIAALSFSYLRDRQHGYDKPLWNCREFRRPSPAQCMKAQTFVETPKPIDDEDAVDIGPRDSTGTPAASALPAAQGLAGVRRKGDPAGEPVAPNTRSSLAQKPVTTFDVR